MEFQTELEAMTIYKAGNLVSKLPEEALNEMIEICQTSEENIFIKNNDYLLSKIK